jgi:hypothetical protein
MMIRPGNRAVRRRHVFGAGGAVALVFALGACGGGAETPAVATAASPGAQSTASATAASGTVAAYVENQRQLAKCLREQGFDVPDPDAKGRIDLASMGGRTKADPKVLAAWEACKEFNQPIPEELQEREPPVTAEQLAHRREYAKCMRANGMPDWPDPNQDGSWPQGGAMGRELTPQEQAANIRALQICEPVLDGRPPTTPNPHASYRG